MRIWWDAEANGLLEEKDGNPPADKIWCIIFRQSNGQIVRFYEGGDNEGFSFEGVEAYISNNPSCEFVCSNQYGYDLELLRRLLGIQYGIDWWVSPSNRVKFTDTLDRSQSQWPDRPHPRGCPYTIPNPVTGKNKRIGSHGLEAWGYRVGNFKPVVHDWRNGDVMDYVHRGEEDTLITKLTHEYLDDEMERNR